MEDWGEEIFPKSKLAQTLFTIFIIWQLGKAERSDWSFLGRDFAIRTVFVEMVISCVFFAFERKPANSKQATTTTTTTFIYPLFRLN